MKAVTETIETKMRAAKIAGPTIASFLGAVHRVIAGETGLQSERDIEPITTLPTLETIEAKADDTLLQQLAVIKLNGGLGTGMGLDRAKSLVVVKGADSFLDFTARQIMHLRGGRAAAAPAFYLMDSFSTQKDTLEYLRKYEGIADEQGQLDFLQNMIPKLDARTLSPVAWPLDADLEWCPPGHGDIYP